MTPESFRLVLALCAVLATVTYIGSVDPVMMMLVVFFAMIAAGVWLAYCLIRWAARRVK